MHLGDAASGREMTHSASVEIVDGFLELLDGVHDERAVAHHWFGNRFAGEEAGSALSHRRR